MQQMINYPTDNIRLTTRKIPHSWRKNKGFKIKEGRGILYGHC